MKAWEHFGNVKRQRQQRARRVQELADRFGQTRAWAESIVGPPGSFLVKSTRPGAVAGVYVLKAEGVAHYKIGVASDVTARVAQVQAASPLPLKIVACIEGRPRTVEQWIHKVLWRHRLHGEWFRECRAILWLVERYRWEGE